MKIEDIYVGMKVVPIKANTTYGFGRSAVWNLAKEIKQLYLYIYDFDKVGMLSLFLNKEKLKNGECDFYSIDEIIPYEEIAVAEPIISPVAKRIYPGKLRSQIVAKTTIKKPVKVVPDNSINETALNLFKASYEEEKSIRKAQFAQQARILTTLKNIESILIENRT